MVFCISVENMRQSDAYTIANFICGTQLMYRAAYGVFASHHWSGRTAIVAGSGNNGGDGYALASILAEKKLMCTVFAVSPARSPDSRHFQQEAVEAGVSIQPFRRGCLEGYDTVVDCLLGTGFFGPLREHYRQAIEEINASSAYVISVDINSGMNGDTGEAELAVRSGLTVTIGFVKTGLVTKNAGNYIKRLICADIGIVPVRDDGIFTQEPCPPWLEREILRVPDLLP